MESENVLYQGKIRDRIMRSLQGGGRSFTEIVRSCQGAYPTVVKSLLDGLESEIVIRPIPVFEPSPELRPSTNGSRLAKLEGNPVLASWYFTDNTCSEIAHLWDWSQRRIVFLGTPRLFEWFARASVGSRRLLLDLDGLVVSTLSSLSSPRDDVVKYDVFTEIPEALRGQFDCVVLDPPWYPEDYELWLHRARVLAPRGSFCFSLFPELTRPEASSERSSIMQQLTTWAEPPTVISEYLEYDVPSFERYQLAAGDITEIGPWKMSDLVICEARISATVPALRGPVRGRAPWTEIDVGPLRLFLDSNSPGSPSPVLLRCSAGGSPILRSPSRRDPALHGVNLLTSRGHGLICSSPRRLASILSRLHATDLSHGLTRRDLDQFDIDGPSKRLLEFVVLGGSNE
jgi:hypothetical protein